MPLVGLAAIVAAIGVFMPKVVVALEAFLLQLLAFGVDVLHQIAAALQNIPR